MTVARRIRKAREACGFSQEDLADLLGLTRSSVSLWKRAQRAEPGESYIEISAEAFDMTLDYLVSPWARALKAAFPCRGKEFRRESMNRALRLAAAIERLKQKK